MGLDITAQGLSVRQRGRDAYHARRMVYRSPRTGQSQASEKTACPPILAMVVASSLSSVTRSDGRGIVVLDGLVDIVDDVGDG